MNQNPDPMAVIHSAGYNRFIIALASAMNGLAGIVVDLYAPGMPAIGREFGVSAATMQQTIVATVLGYALGQLFFGALADWRGRRPSIMLGLTLFTAGSVLGAWANDIAVLIAARALQGFAVGSCQVVARAILIDNLKGKKFEVWIIYLSVAFALGLIAAPFIGGIVQENLGWRWNFAIYAAYGLTLLVTVSTGLRESLSSSRRRPPAGVFHIYAAILKNRPFWVCGLQLGCCFIGLTMWNQIGPYIIQKLLHYSPAGFGVAALLVGCGYFAGTLCNRFLVKRTHPETRLRAGMIVFTIGGAIISFSGTDFNIWLITPGILICAFAQGITFPIVLTRALSFFPNFAGVAASPQGCGMLVIGSGELALVSLSPVNSGLGIAGLYGALLLMALFAFFMALKPSRDS